MPPIRRRATARPVLIPALALVSLLTLASASARAGMESIETRDLRLVYHAPTQSFIAPYAARCFERSLMFYERVFEFAPSERTTVILDDAADYANAGVWVTPRNSMLMHLAPSNFVYETGPSNERINFTMNHECAHIVTLDQAAGRDRLFRGLFHGKVSEDADHPETMLYSWLTVPRRASPRWFREGAAVFCETWMAGGLGRAQGPWDEMVFRAMVADSTRIWDPLGLESEGTKTDFQAGVNSYLYGTRFITWLAWEHGPDPVVQWVRRAPGSRAYFASRFRQVFGRPLGTAWQEWIAFERGFQRANLDSIERYPVTPHRDLAHRALGSVSRAYVDSASNSLVAAVFHPGAVSQVAALSLGDGSMRPLQEIKGPALYFVSALAFDPDRRRLFYTTDNDEWRDLRVLDLATGRSRLLIRDARLGDLAYDRVHRALWAVRHFNGISSVVRLAEPYTDWTRAVSLPYGRDVYDLDVSPDGATLACSMAEIDGRQTLRLLDAATLAAGDTTSRTLHDFGASIPTNFVFTPDGRALVGSSYLTGVSNIFRYDLERRTMDIVSNTTTGFFRPIPLGADSLIVFRYTGEGFVPAVIPMRPLQDVNAISFFGARVVARHPVLKTWKVPPPSAIALDSLVTRRGPYRGIGEVGFTTVYPMVEAYKDLPVVGARLHASDPLSMHRFELDVAYSPQPEVPSDERVHLSTRYRTGDVTAQVRWNPASFYDLFGPTKSSRRGVNTSLGWERTLVRDRPRSLTLNAGASSWAGLERLPDAQNVETAAGFDQLVASDLSLAYRDLRSSLGAVDQEKGWAWDLAAGVNTVRFVRGGDAAWKGYPYAQAGLDAGVPLPMPHSSLWLRTAVGGSPGDPAEPFANFYFGGFGNNWVDRQDPRQYRRPERFPGIPIDAAGGTRFAKGMLDLNLPPLRFSRLGRPALYATWVRASLFGGALATDAGDAGGRRTLGNVGAQLDLRVQLLMQQPLTFSLGYARAFERAAAAQETWMASLKIL